MVAGVSVIGMPPARVVATTLPRRAPRAVGTSPGERGSPVRSARDRPRRRLLLARDRGDDLAPRPPLDGSRRRRRRDPRRGLHRPLDRLVPAPPRPVAAHRDRRARDRGLRRVRPERRLVRAGLQPLDGAARPPPRRGRRAADAAGDVRRRRRGRAAPAPRRGSTRASTRAARSASRAAPRACRRSSTASREYERFGFGDRYRLLDAAELSDRIRIAGAVRALVGDGAAVIHPGRLVRGLARAVERQATTIVEGTRVTGFRPRDESGLATLATAGRRAGAGRSCSPARPG